MRYKSKCKGNSKCKGDTKVNVNRKDIDYRKIISYTASIVSELGNAIEYAVMMEKEKSLQFFSLPQRILDASKGETAHELLSLRKKLKITEKETILKTLNHTQWVKKQAAQIMGINPKNLSYFLKKHHISKINGKP